MRAVLAHCSAKSYLWVSRRSLGSTRTVRVDSLFKLQPCRSHIREVQGRGPIDLDGNFEFRDGLAVLSLAKVRVSLENGNVSEIT